MTHVDHGSKTPGSALRDRWRRLARREDGGALVEFAISLPIILILALLTVESMRFFWSYQAAIAGVRDATRYFARIAPDDICTAGGSVSGYASQLESIVETTITGASLFTSGVSVSSLTPALTCVTSLGLRQASVPVATISANVTISMPFSQILRIVGGTPTATINTTVRDQARVYGL
jgi:Flp pilus assembly protein TadG